MSLWLTKYFLRNILQFSVIIHAAVIRQYVVLFCVRDCFYVYMGNKICEIDECILF